MRSDNEAVKVERFGRPGGPLLVSIVNTTNTPQHANLRFNAAKLGLKLRSMRLRDFIAGSSVSLQSAGDALICRVNMAPDQAMVLSLAP